MNPGQKMSRTVSTDLVAESNEDKLEWSSYMYNYIL